MILRDSGSVFFTFVAWSIAFIFSICQVAVYTELSTRIPYAGGDYDFLSAAFGRRVGFSFSFSSFFVMKAGSLAILGRTFAEYIVRAIRQPIGSLAPGVCPAQVSFHSITPTEFVSPPGEIPDIVYRLTAVACAVCLTVLCLLSVSIGARVMLALTILKFTVIASVVALSFASLFAHGTHTASVSFVDSLWSIEGVPAPSFIGLANAIVACMWACDGWNGITYIAEELKDPRHSLPRASVAGVVVVFATFIALNIAYLITVPAPAAVRSTAIGMASVAAASGCSRAAVGLVAALVGVGVLASQHASMMTGARYVYATARDGAFPRPLAHVSGAGTPAGALLAQGGWVCLLLLSPVGSSLGSLIGYFGAASSIYYGLVGAAALVMRRRDAAVLSPSASPGGAVRPSSIDDVVLAQGAWRMPCPVVWCGGLVVFAALLVAALFIDRPLPTAAAVAFVLLALPAQYVGEAVAAHGAVRPFLLNWGIVSDRSARGGLMDRSDLHRGAHSPMGLSGDEDGEDEGHDVDPLTHALQRDLDDGSGAGM